MMAWQVEAVWACVGLQAFNPGAGRSSATEADHSFLQGRLTSIPVMRQTTILCGQASSVLHNSN